MTLAARNPPRAVYSTMIAAEISMARPYSIPKSVENSFPQVTNPEAV